jgi:predicted dinucleotide-binding enzyme
MSGELALTIILARRKKQSPDEGPSYNLYTQILTIMPITKQTIAIIGAAGTMGSAIAKNIGGGNYRLLLFDKSQERLSTLAKKIHHLHPKADLEPMDCAHECSWEADIIIMAVPNDQERVIAQTIHDVVTQKVVISLANPSGKDLRELTVDPIVSMAEKLQKQLPHSKVVKAFNTLSADDFKQPVINGQKIDTFIAGEDEQALEMVAELTEHAGFNPIKVDDLAFSRTLEQMPHD